MSGPVEGRWELPEGWTWRKAADFARIVGGSTPKNASDESNFDPEGTPWITPADLSGYSQPTISAGRRNLAAHVIKREVLLPAGSVLISSRAPVGYCAISANPVATNQGFRSLILDEDVDPFFIRYYVIYSRAYLEENARGTTFKELSGSALGELLFPLAPINIQRRIVARVDELFAEVDDGQVALARARSDLAIWRKALLKAAVTGELTAGWRAANPPTETGTALLARILADHRACWLAEPCNKGKRYTPPNGPKMDELPSLPEGWVWAGIEQLTTGGIRNGLSVKESSTPTDVKGLRLDALQPEGVDWTRSRYLPISKERASNYTLRVGDLLISRANGSPEYIGRCSLVSETRPNTVFPDTAIRYPLWGSRTFQTWVQTTWSAPTSRKLMLQLAKSTAGILKISQGDIAAVALPLPPLAELTAINALVGRLSDEAEAGHDDLKSLRVAPSTLRQSILAAAFRGDLVA